MVFNAIFNNIFAISWQSVLLVEETGVPGEIHQTAVSQLQIYYIMVLFKQLYWLSCCHLTFRKI